MNRQQTDNPTPPAELIITTEPEFPGQVVWECNGTLGIAPDEATARADAAALAQPEPEVVVTDEELLRMAAEALGYESISPGSGCTYGAVEAYGDELLAFARAVLARFGHQPAPPTEGEVEARNVAGLFRRWADAYPDSVTVDPHWLTRAAALLEQRHPAPVPAGMIPVEYWDIDSGARIVTEPSEEGPGGCWVVLNSRHVNPFTEFPTAKAAWDALQQAHALPLPSGEVEHG